MAEVGETLARLLAASGDIADKDRSLLASLRLSLERLDKVARAWLPRLGVFQGGAFENNLLAITEIDESTWQGLRQQLEATGLIQVEWLRGVLVPYIKFHPTLALALWSELSKDTQKELLICHRQHYYKLSLYLYNENKKNPYEYGLITRRELPNLMLAVQGSIDAKEEEASNFVNNVNFFLFIFGFKRDHAALSKKAESLLVTFGSIEWFQTRTNEAKHLLEIGRAEAAVQKFEEILDGLSSECSYERCRILNYIGRCFLALQQLPSAAEYYRMALAEIDQLEISDSVTDIKAGLQSDLAIVLMQMGNYPESQTNFAAALSIAKRFKNIRDAAVIKGNMGTLAMYNGDLPESVQCYEEVLKIFQELSEPSSEAIAWHQLGRVQQELKEWEAAEQAYRRSAEMHESLGERLGAAKSWIQLASIKQHSGNQQEAEEWYRKAISVLKSEQNLTIASMCSLQLG